MFGLCCTCLYSISGSLAVICNNIYIRCFALSALSRYKRCFNLSIWWSTVLGVLVCNENGGAISAKLISLRQRIIEIRNPFNRLTVTQISVLDHFYSERSFDRKIAMIRILKRIKIGFLPIFRTLFLVMSSEIVSYRPPPSLLIASIIYSF